MMQKNDEFELETISTVVQREAYLHARFAAQSNKLAYKVITESIGRKPLITVFLIGVPFASIFIYCLGYFTDYNNNDTSVRNLFRSFYHVDETKISNAVGSIMRSLANIFSLSITISGVILQLVSNRYTPQARRLFFEDWQILIMVAFILTTLLLLLITLFAVGNLYLPRVNYIICLIMSYISVLLIFPFFYQVFNFLDPSKIVNKIEHSILNSISNNRHHTTKNQVRVIRGIDHLSEIARLESQTKGRNLSSSVLDSLLSITLQYMDLKHSKPVEWFSIPLGVKSTADFEFMPELRIQQIERRRMWLEAKVLKQFLVLFMTNAKGELYELCFLAAANNRRIAEAALRKGDLELVKLCIEHFNLYLRYAVNSLALRVAYHVMYQYRQLGEAVLFEMHKNKHNTSIIDDLNNICITTINKHWTYYFNLSRVRKQNSTERSIANDRAYIIEVAYSLKEPVHETLLHGFLDPVWCQNTTQIKHLPVSCFWRKALIKLATSYISGGNEEYARLIFQKLEHESTETLLEVWNDFMSVESMHFWEVTERVLNFDFLNNKQRNALRIFFGWFDGMEELLATIPVVTVDDEL